MNEDVSFTKGVADIYTTRQRRSWRIVILSEAKDLTPWHRDPSLTLRMTVNGWFVY